MKNYKELKSCLVCGNSDLTELFNFNDQPLINNLKDRPIDNEERYPLILNFCSQCSHHQLSISVNPDLMFKNYLYQTGTSSTHQDYFKRLVSIIKGKTVLDIGCNDGSLLKEFKKHDWDVMGIDPAQNLNIEGIPIIKEFFPSDKLYGKKFDCIMALNVFAHNSYPFEFLLGIKSLLNEGGEIYIQTAPIRMGNIYHEHISYFNPVSMSLLALKCDLEIAGFQNVSMHGGSHLFRLKRLKNFTPSPRIEFPKLDNPLVGYGAAANGMSLLNYHNISPEYIVDDNILKQGKFTPGTNIPIYHPDRLINDNRDLNIVILAYNLFDEIVTKIKTLRPTKNDTFIHPLR